MKKSTLKSLIENIVKQILKENIPGIPPTKLPATKQKPETVYPPNFREVPNYIRLKKKPETKEILVAWFTGGKFNDNKSYYTNDIKDAVDTFNGMKHVVDIANKVGVTEESTTGNVSGYNIPAAFSRRGGSQRGVAGSSKLGYDLTPIGKKEMNRRGDTL